NDGLEWKAVNTGLTNTDVRSMMVYSTVIYAGTWGGGIFVSRDYGGVWRYIALKERYITDMLLVNLYAYAATTSGIVKSSDLGLSWYEFALPFNSVNSLHYAAGVFLAGTDVGMQRSTDYGARWQYVGGDTRKISAIAGNGSFLCAAASTGAGLMSVDTGQSWTEIDIGKRNVSVGSLIVDKNHVFVAEEDGTIQSCTLEDYHWNTVYASPSRKLVSCFTSHGTDYYAGSRSGVLKSTNGTTAWTMLGLPDNDIRALLWNDACLYAGTFSSGLFKSPDGGLTWSSLGLMHRTITSVFVNNKRVFACTDSGLYSTTNSGQQWRELGEGTIHKDVRSLVCIGTTLYAGTYGGGVFVSYDDGEKWTAFNAGLSNLNVQSLVAYGSKLFVGTNGSGVFVFLNKFKEWIQCNVGLPARDVQSLYLYNSTLYAGTTGMSVFALYLHSIPFGVDSSLYN
ncbi:MAG: WD40/YVTN/BNR-like repeat-containing protein, partial [Candidatus Kapaibacterium sp.]